VPHRRRCLTTAAATALAALSLTGSALAADVLVSSGSPPGPFSQNKQNEPAVAIDPTNPDVLAAGANDNIDMELCNAGDDTTCPFTPGVGVSGIYVSTDRGASWTQPTYTGLTARGCTGVVGNDDPDCTPTEGPIGTLPNYDDAGLASDGDPAVAFGPAPGAGGDFSWSNGSRLYYANLTSAIPGAQRFRGFEAIAVSHTDDVAAAAAGDEAAWSAPVIASRQNSALFADKEQVWADNAESSPFFGNVYVCFAAFQGAGQGGVAQPLKVLTSRDGGESWTSKQVTAAANNTHSRQGFGRSGCTVRTDSTGRIYVFVYQFGFSATGSAPGSMLMITSDDGGQKWSRPRTLFTAFDLCTGFEPSIGRCVMDGVAGARDDLGPAPSVDIANGAPSGEGATNQIVMAWADGRDGLNDEDVMFSTSTNRGGTWTAPARIQQPGDRGYYAAPAISPDGTDVYVVYNAFTEPFKDSTEGPDNERPLVGVVQHADVGTGGAIGDWTVLNRGATGDARGSSQNDLAAEFLGDYVYAAATNDYGAAVWNDVRNASDCPAVDAYRQDLHDEAVATGQQTAEAEEPRGEAQRERGPNEGEDAEAGDPPAPQQDCPLTFGNSDIFGGAYDDPTP
jgi:hypothetical protein